jgi:predicted regulator of Ras-like GTPase activity (Roadblock/LC7/MglB family)
MTDLKSIAQLPEVKSAVLADMAGGFLDAVREPDGESVAAVTGFLTSTMNQAGEELGLGALREISFCGQARACLVVVQGGSVTTAVVEPPASIQAVEKALEAPAQGS